MLIIANLFIFLSLIFILLQDFKQRRISWFLIPVSFIGFIYKAIFYNTIALSDFLFNAAFILLQLICLTIYFSIKNKRFVNIIDCYLGLGDVLFFILICTVFSPVNFILFYITSLFLTLTGVIIYNFFSARQTNTIPLAGAMAGMLLILVGATFLVPGMDLYNDDFLLNIIH